MRFIILLLISFQTAGLVGQKICVEQLLVPNNLSEDQHSIAVYTGKDDNPDHTVRRSIITQPSTVKWAKKRIEDCESDNEDDCFTWERVKQEEETIDTIVVLDTLNQTDYRNMVITFDKRDRLHSEYRRVICVEDFSNRTKKELREALDKVGYRVNSDEAILYAVREYQFDNRLPVGGLDAETLEHLGLDNLARRLLR